MRYAGHAGVSPSLDDGSGPVRAREAPSVGPVVGDHGEPRRADSSDRDVIPDMEAVIALDDGSGRKSDVAADSASAIVALVADRLDVADPGDLAVIATVNVTAVATNLDILAERAEVVTFIQEVSLAATTIPGVEGALAVRGVKAILGPPDPEALKPTGGVGAIAHAVRQLQRLDPIDPTDHT